MPNTCQIGALYFDRETASICANNLERGSVVKINDCSKLSIESTDVYCVGDNPTYVVVQKDNFWTSFKKFAHGFSANFGAAGSDPYCATPGA
ncbi:MAG: hypothetical protein ACD_62C00428G0002 [uncultured bacterium]|nr:MAG: hypothetical protein ACD_62C00428G0002 [uncultured bacterium]HLD43888.1 hypothetical protein [bacterium]